jgi:N-acetylglutamate synthase-like GNAT family acetyltransferase
MMEAIKYSEIYRTKLGNLLKSRNMPVELIDDLPENGFVIIDLSDSGRTAIAAGFLRKIENNFGLLDAFVTHAQYPPYKRNEALLLLVERLVERAKDLRLSQLFAWSSNPSILKRADQKGFKNLNTQMVSKSLDGSIGLWDF